MSQIWPLQNPMELDKRIVNSSVPRELVLKIKEEFQGGASMEELEDKYGIPVVREVMGEKNEEKKENVVYNPKGFKIGDPVKSKDGKYTGKIVELTGDKLQPYGVDWDGESTSTDEPAYYVEKTNNQNTRDARKDFPPGTKVDMGGGYTGVVTKAESSEAVWVKPDDGGEEVLCKLNKQPIKKLRNSVKNVKSIDDMSQEIQHRIDAQKNPEKKKKMLEYQKTFKSYAKHHTPADEGYAAATYDDIMGLASNSDPGTGEKKNIKYDYNNPEHKALRDKVAKDMLGKKWSECSPMEMDRVLKEVEKANDQDTHRSFGTMNGKRVGF